MGAFSRTSYGIFVQKGEEGGRWGGGGWLVGWLVLSFVRAFIVRLFVCTLVGTHGTACQI